MFSRYLLLCCLLFSGSCCLAQSSIFEFDYHFDINNTREQYSAFMLRNGDGTGFMRVRFMDEKTNTPVVVDMEIQEHYMGDEDQNDSKQTDSSILVFEGIDPQVVVGDPNIKYDPDIFWFYKNKKTGYYEPEAVVSQDDNGKDVEGIFKMKLLNQADLTKELVSKYFTAQDGVYENIAEEATVRIPPSQKSTKLYLLLVANTDDISIGTTCVVDKDATYKTFSQLAEFMQLQFIPKLIFGKDFSKVNVDNAINALAPGPSDIVVFYYSGHGFSNNKDNYVFPYLDLRDKSFQTYGGQYTLNMEEIYKRIKAKGGRLNLIMSDCCNSDPSQTNSISSDVATTRSSSIGWNMENCRALFMRDESTSILMTAASKGQLSAGNAAGGIFTFNFRESLEKIIGPFSNNVNWEDLLNTTKKQTINKAQRTWCKQEDNTRKVCEQSPVFKLN